MTAAPVDTSRAIDSGSRHDRGAELYDAECALHTAHQTRNDAWIDAASAKLHQALTDYLTELAIPRNRGDLG
jgi:hypothetical protein